MAERRDEEHDNDLPMLRELLAGGNALPWRPSSAGGIVSDDLSTGYNGPSDVAYYGGALVAQVER